MDSSVHSQGHLSYSPATFWKYITHCKCDWTDTGAKQGFSQLIAFIVHHIVELCRENIGKIPYWLSLFKKQGLSQTQQ